ncbi:MAG: hypothetical protein OK474_01185 [Thaumarchaeota archaeon]|nr:hypothetical protein [Nitrososphaerota archaeon]
MSEYKRQIAAGATVAVVVVFVLALGVGAFFPEATSSESLTTTATSGTLTASSSTFPTSSTPPSSSISSSGTTSSTATSSGVGATSTTTITTTVPATSNTVPFTSTTTTASASTTTTTLTTTAVSTTVCYTCGILKIESVNLTIGAAAGNRTILSLTIANNGSEDISNLSVSLASTVVVVIPALAAGTQTWVSIQVPDSQPIEAGQSYQVIIQGGYGSYPTGAITTVEASSS